MFRIAVYAIAKNEEQFVDRWYESVKYADSIFVLDTGSTDNTNAMLREREVNVFEAYLEPFRFDVARNMILNQISADEFDFAVFLDMDEVLEPGWYSSLQQLLTDVPTTTAVHTRLIYTQNPDGTPGITYNRLMVTRVGYYHWYYPVHEVLVPKEDTVVQELYSDIRVRHLPDEQKSRSSYLDLLYTGAQENPNDARCAQYLARELAATGNPASALGEYARHLELEKNRWFRSETYRAMAICYEQQEDTKEARDCHTLACAEAPDLREPWAEAAAFYYRMQRMHSALGCIENMLDVTEPPTHTVIRNDAYYGAWPHHMAALCYHRLGDNLNARKQINAAFRLSQSDPAILSDLMLICNIAVKETEQSSE